ncbi:MAG: hypothetical protein CSA66_00335 [Proteobacteria bacterium]|nr:MAG: hypothetical protein CSA66_00335 [Pseudomonadota bacterium]
MRHAALALTLALAATAACAEFDPPPEASLVQPADGKWTQASPLEVAFTEPIDPTSLVVTVWPNALDLEGDLSPEARPIVDACTLFTSPCGGFVMTVNDDRTRVTIDFHDTFKDHEGVPLILEVHAGLKDRAGRTRKVKSWFDFQVSPLCGNQTIAIDLQSNVISLTADLQVLPIWLHMFLDLGIDPATGDVLVVATFARVEQGLPPNYNHPDGFELALDESTWAVEFSACLIEQGDGTYFLQSDPFDVNIVVLNAIPVTLAGFQVQGTIEPGGGEDGRDAAAGTLSTTGGSFGDPPTQVDPITTAWDGFGFAPEELPEELPRTCAERPCKDLDAVGADCQLDDPWVPGDVCPG